mmetsp:Transcript_16766/g.38572  ORF Transcript_16766/g.38572 Transcript_16766/m.38572 type:complete len:182 (-) Transcript_16766:377-922(-)
MEGSLVLIGIVSHAAITTTTTKLHSLIFADTSCPAWSGHPVQHHDPGASCHAELSLADRLYVRRIQVCFCTYDRKRYLFVVGLHSSRIFALILTTRTQVRRKKFKTAREKRERDHRQQIAVPFIYPHLIMSDRLHLGEDSSSVASFEDETEPLISPAEGSRREKKQVKIKIKKREKKKVIL